eukprot:gene11188-7765_t
MFDIPEPPPPPPFLKEKEKENELLIMNWPIHITDTYTHTYIYTYIYTSLWGSSIHILTKLFLFLSFAFFFSIMSAEHFVAATEYVRSLPKDGPVQLENDIKLHFYALFKQATEGDVKGSQPWAVQIEARSKWDAWNKLKGKSAEDAKKEYPLKRSNLSNGRQPPQVEKKKQQKNNKNMYFSLPLSPFLLSDTATSSI